MLQLENLREGEKVQMVIRRHWIVFLILGIHAFIGILVNVVLYTIFGFEFWVNMFSLVYLMAFSVFMYIAWINHELDMYVITNSRIIGIEQIGFLDRIVSQCALNDVQEVNSKTTGFFANMLNYGDLTIQTAGNASNFKMEYVPDSLQGSRKVLNIVEEYKGDLNKRKK